MQHITAQVREKLCDALMTLLGDDSSLARLNTFTQYLDFLKHYEHEIPSGLLRELTDLSNDFYKYFIDEAAATTPEKELTAEQEAELTERLLSIYIEVKGGGLIF
jgi:hypothetical protein